MAAYSAAKFSKQKHFDSLNRQSMHGFGATYVVKLTRILPTCISSVRFHKKIEWLFMESTWNDLQIGMCVITKLLMSPSRVMHCCIILCFQKCYLLWKVSQNLCSEKINIIRSRELHFKRLEKYWTCIRYEPFLCAAPYMKCMSAKSTLVCRGRFPEFDAKNDDSSQRSSFIH